MNEKRPGRPRETTHDEIRSVALELFREQGYGATSLASIARAAGVSRTTLFAYFRSKRDLIWEDHDQRVESLENEMANGLVAEPPGAVVDLVVGAMLVNARYGVEEHALLATRLEIAGQDEELRAYGALAARETTDRLVALVHRNVGEVDATTVDLVVRALVGAASGCTEQWAALDAPNVSLDVWTHQRIAPIADALRPLLP
jgi:AcrR family transcriptional regulator